MQGKHALRTDSCFQDRNKHAEPAATLLAPSWSEHVAESRAAQLFRKALCRITASDHRAAIAAITKNACLFQVAAARYLSARAAALHVAGVIKQETTAFTNSNGITTSCVQLQLPISHTHTTKETIIKYVYLCWRTLQQTLLQWELLFFQG